jgi:hypothetical protein
MKRLPYVVALAGLMALTPTVPAWATGGFSCSVDDANLSLEVSSPLGRGMGSPIINLEATATIKLKSTPADLSKPEFKGALVHSWMAHPDLRLHFYREREGNTPHGYVELVIKTTMTAEEDGTAGTYELDVFFTEPVAGSKEPQTLKATGPITCSVE